MLSGDTTFNENLIDHAQGADLLVHEVTALSGTAADSAAQLKRIGSNHTTPEQAGDVFARIKPKLAVYNHLLLFGGATPDDLIPATRKQYSGGCRGRRLDAIRCRRKYRTAALSQLRVSFPTRR